MKEALKRARKARDQLAIAQSDLEEALGKASPKLSSKGKAAAQGWSMTISKTLVSLKAVLNSEKKMTSAGLKELLEEAGKIVKNAKDEKKELNIVEPNCKQGSFCDQQENQEQQVKFWKRYHKSLEKDKFWKEKANQLLSFEKKATFGTGNLSGFSSTVAQHS